MLEIPLILKLKKERHKNIARAQDIIIEELYKMFNNAVIHGGTSIWRCYKGNRFSEDIDVYIEKNKNKVNKLFENLEKRGFIIEKKKISENSLYSTLKFNDVIVRLEALFKRIKGILKEYEKADGNLITVYTLTPEVLIKEKIEAFLKRNKIRDLYDVFFLIRFSNRDKIRSSLKKLIRNMKKPEDEEDLSALIIQGVVPNSKEMFQYIKSKI